MSDLCMYELEDIVWEDFCQSDDHIVPRHSGEQENGILVQGNISSKRQRNEGSCDASDTGETILKQKTEQENLTLYDRRCKMLEKEAWSQKPAGVIRSSGESVKEMSSLASETTNKSSHCFKSNMESVGSDLCANDSVHNDKTTAVDNPFGHTTGHFSEADDGLSFFGNSHEDKDSSDLLYYGWSNIGNFEDVDRMFRGCDSTFGLGGSNENDMGWFSSSDAIGGSEDALKSDLQFSCPESSVPKCVSETHHPSRLNSTSNESTMQNISVKSKDNFWPSGSNGSSPLGYMSFSNGSNGSDSRDGFVPEGQVIVPEKELKMHTQSQMGRKDQYLDYDSFFSINHTLPIDRQQRQVLETDSVGYLESDIHFSNPSAAKLENSSLMSLSQEDSYRSNQVKSMESSIGPPFQVTSMASNETGATLYHQHGFQASLDSRSVDFALENSKGGPVNKKVNYFGSEFGELTDDNRGKSKIPAEVRSVAQESPSMKSGLNDISAEAASFRQLQHVMKRLDIRTKLCIRDSLYRLARSAEQRHTGESPNGGCPVDGDAVGAFVAEGEHKYTGFMDIETDTNPIDRSVAHLLFHRPSESAVTAGNDSVSFNSPTPINGSIGCSTMMAEEFVKQEETAGDIDRKVVAGN